MKIKRQCGRAFFSQQKQDEEILQKIEEKERKVEKVFLTIAFLAFPFMPQKVTISP